VWSESADRDHKEKRERREEEKEREREREKKSYRYFLILSLSLFPSFPSAKSFSAVKQKDTAGSTFVPPRGSGEDARTSGLQGGVWG